MSTFLSSFALYTAILLIIAVPVMMAARRLGKRSTMRNFAVCAVGIGLAVALVRVTSKIAVEQCLDAGNTNCVDAGGAGLIVLFVGGFAVVALGRAWSIGR